MAEQLGSAVLELSTDDRRYAEGVRRAKGQAVDLQQGLDRTGRSSLTLGARLATLGTRARAVAASFVNLRTAAVAAATIGGLFLLTERAIAAADRIAKLSDAVGISTDALQELRFAADRSGVSVSGFDQAIAFFSRTVGNAVRLGGEAARVFEDIGVAILDSHGNIRPLEAILTDVAEAYSGMDSAAQRASASQALFGRAGIEMGNLMREGADGVNSLRETAQRLGIVISEDVLRRAEQANDEIGDMKAVFSAAGSALALELMPAMRALAQALTDPRVVEGARTLGQAIANIIGFIVENGDTVVRVMGALSGLLIGGRAGPWGALAGAIGGAFAPEIIDAIAGEPRIDEIRRELIEIGNEFHRTIFRAPGANTLEETAQFLLDQEAAGVGTIRQQLGPDAERARELFQRHQDLRLELSAIEGAASGAGLALTEFGEGVQLAGSAAAEAITPEEQLRALIEGLNVQARALRGEFPHLAEGAAEILHGFGLLGDGTGALTQDMVDLNDALLGLSQAQRGREIFEQTRTAAERYAAALAELQELLAAGAIDQETFNRAAEEATAAFEAATESTVDWGQAMQGVGQLAAQSLGEIRRGAFDAARALEQLEDILWRVLVLNPFEQAISQIDIGGFIGDPFGGGSSGSATTSSVGAGLSALHSAHTGGIIGRLSSPRRQVSPMALLGAPRFHSSGLVGDERAIIAKVGEGVFTPEQMADIARGLAAGSRGGTQVVVEDHRRMTAGQSGGPAIGAADSLGPDGESQIRIMVFDAFSDLVESGRMHPVMASAYGVRPQGAG